MRLDKISSGDRVIVFMPHPSIYDDKYHKALTDPTAVGYDGTVTALGKNYQGEEIVWVKLAVDDSVIECYPEELIPFYGYTAEEAREAPALPSWVMNEDEMLERIYQHEWKKAPFDRCFGHIFKHLKEARKHLEWLRENGNT